MDMQEIGLKDLFFCRTIEECAAFSEKFNKKGFKTVALWKRFNGEKTGKRRKTIPWRRRGETRLYFFL